MVFQKLLRHIIGVRIEETNPFLVRRLDPGQAGEQMGQTVLQSEILAVAGRILARSG